MIKPTPVSLRAIYIAVTRNKCSARIYFCIFLRDSTFYKRLDLFCCELLSALSSTRARKTTDSKGVENKSLTKWLAIQYNINQLAGLISAYFESLANQTSNSLRWVTKESITYQSNFLSGANGVCACHVGSTALCKVLHRQLHRQQDLFG